VGPGTFGQLTVEIKIRFIEDQDRRNPFGKGRGEASHDEALASISGLGGHHDPKMI